MLEWGFNDRGGRGGEVVGVYQFGFECCVVGFVGEVEGVGYCDGIGGFGDGGVEQYGVIVEFQCLCGVVGCVQVGVDYQCDVRQVFVQQV